MRAVANSETARRIAERLLESKDITLYVEDEDDEFAMWGFSDKQERSVQIFDDGSIMVRNVEDRDEIIINVLEIVRLMFPKKDKGRWISAAIMEMLSQGEYRLSEVSRCLQIDAYQQIRYLWLRGRIARRQEEVAAKNAAYATSEWYKANGITNYTTK